jgi:hypothetical protein
MMVYELSITGFGGLCPLFGGFCPFSGSHTGAQCFGLWLWLKAVHPLFWNTCFYEVSFYAYT